MGSNPTLSAKSPTEVAKSTMGTFRNTLSTLLAKPDVMMRRLTFSVAAASAIFGGIYFSFLADEPNESLTGIWLGFGLLMLTLGWPGLVKSINFFGNSIELRELNSEVRKLSNLMNSYWSDLKKENDFAQNELGFAINIDTSASFLSLDITLDERLDSTQHISETISKRLNGIWPEIIDFLKENNIETAEIENLPYQKNALVKPEWEYINIGIPNSFAHIRLILSQLALKHYESLDESGVILSKSEIERVEFLKKRLTRYAGNVLVD